MNIDQQFAHKIGLCFYLLGAESDIISTVNSWRDTLSDTDVLGSIDAWLIATLDEQKAIISHVEKSDSVSVIKR
jgi:hypothetical protein